MSLRSRFGSLLTFIVSFGSIFIKAGIAGMIFDNYHNIPIFADSDPTLLIIGLGLWIFDLPLIFWAMQLRDDF
ncbi:hypothetical protein [Methanococcus maripaludis]|uniref:Uncharacterized protein n=1 Tax=Methanococcus maripaludis TaxID=39152 RepID=A0A7J9PNY3_METMI|nr:hypothetical protein [Methanococcus maripaludis]MBA2864426.1 hypothetical protein [Methanococcus maripaludis]